MTAEHLRPLLESVKDMTLFWELAQDLARAAVPDVIVDSVRLGRITALQKPNGGVRGIVAGDMIRRLVARTISQQLSEAVERATSPFQYALTTPSGGECIAHALQALTDLDDRATVLSIDGIGASHEVRCSMVRGRSLVVSRSSLSSCNSTATLPPLCGKMILVKPTRSTKAKEESRAILRCPCSTHWGNIKPFVQSSLSFCRMSASLRSLTTSTSSHSPSGRWRSTTFSGATSGTTAASRFTLGRPKSGTEGGTFQRTMTPCCGQPKLRIQRRRFGSATLKFLQKSGGSKFWELLWELPLSSGHGFSPRSNTISCFLTASQASKTCSLRGSSSSSVPLLGPRTTSGFATQSSPLLSPDSTTSRCAVTLHPSPHGSWPVFPCTWGDWAFAVLPAWPTRHIGAVGLRLSPHCGSTS